MKKVIIFGVSVASLGAVSLLIWFYSKANSKKKHRIQIQIPNSLMGHVIGRCGGTLKDIQMKSKARIHFLAPEDSSNYTACVIKGDSNSVQLASGIINDFVEKLNNEEDIKSSHSDEFEFQVSDEKLLKDISRVVEGILDEHLNHFTNDTDEVAETETENVNDFISRHTQKLYSPGGDGLIPVYVSAVCNPEKFWIQLIKTKEHADLDRLTEKMFDHYNSDVNLSVPPPFDHIKMGYLCAVFYEDDNRWYRAKVCDVLKNDQNSFQSTVDLYLLDFGESIYEKVSNIRPMPSEFFNLNFQAIECGLSNIRSSAKNWSDEAIQYFEDVVHVGQWYTLMARIDFHEEGYRPYLTLIDNNGDVSTNIAEKLVANGFGKILN